MAADGFQVKIEDGVAICSMSGPNMNAMGTDMVPAMRDGFKSVMEDDGVRVIVLRGEGGNFSSGADLSFMGEKMDPIALRDAMHSVGRIISELHDGPRPVISEVDGWAAGGGFSLALASDITYATDRARFIMSFVRISLITDFAGGYFLARRCGLARAKDLCLSGRAIDAQEALQMGVVNRVLPPEEISAEVLKLAKRMATRPAMVLEMIKHNLNVSDRVDLKTFLELEAHAQSICVMTDAHRQDVAKFLNKESGE
ncbi:MAG: hypothetical protein CVU59_12610 [Deltaproteobacteria bacterium HGW-Deltaproteobacteria-17]|nr:MAG: hypothetical protein CVU59_12610 [Deltaproteobacteria bacterium HGW-Deltaproteobacteria-17]